MNKGYVSYRELSEIVNASYAKTKDYERDWCVVLRGLGDGGIEGLLRF